MFRIGHGFDVHKFSSNPDEKPLIIGGVKLTYDYSLVAHSDGDVLIHAICDALLGAAGLGDIGQHFPDNDAAFKDADSGLLLSQVCEMVRDRGHDIGNIDATIVAQKPRMAPYINKMKVNIGRFAGISADCVNIKATTTEKLGFEGRSEGISSHAVTLIVNK